MAHGGHNKHIPTEKTKAAVESLVSFGITQEDIARYLEISVDTLAIHYRNELDNAVLRANAQVAGKLFKKAVVQEDLSAIIFWLKTRGRWRTADKDDENKMQTLVEKMIEKMADK